MKTKNIKIGQPIYLKTFEEVAQSKYFKKFGDLEWIGRLGCDDELGCIEFTDGSMFYSRYADSICGGQLVIPIQITSLGNIIFETGEGREIISRHAFRKPTAEEISGYSGCSQLCIHISEKEINNEKSSI